MKKLLIILYLIGIIASLAFAQGENVYQSKCFRDKKLDLVIRANTGKNYVFTDYELWKNQNHNSEILEKKQKWYIKKFDGSIKDIELLETVEMYELAEIVKAEYAKELRKTKRNLYVGIPTGLFILSGAGVWTYDITKETPEAWEVAISTMLGLTGIGLIWRVSHSYAHRNDEDMYEHKITFKQAQDILDRYNNGLKKECMQKE